MARVAAVTWFPRTYINLFETFIGLDKVDLKKRDVTYDPASVSFTFEGYKEYPPVKFTQTWGGLHVFEAEFPDEGVVARSDAFMKEMQNVLLEKILRVCHTVTYKAIVSDAMSVDFHTIVLTKSDIIAQGYATDFAGDLEIRFKPQDLYYGGTTSYVIGTDNQDIIEPLLLRAYAEVAYAFMFNMMKAYVRLFHNVDKAMEDIESSKNGQELKKAILSLQAMVGECSSRQGKMRHVMLNLKLTEDFYKKSSYEGQAKDLLKAFCVPEAFDKLEADGTYLQILWGDMMESKLRDVRFALDTALKLKTEDGKKSWF